MSYADGWAAINLEMPPRVPRTEYSAEMHWELVTAVTGMAVTQNSDANFKCESQKAFRRAWNYGLIWNVLIFGDEFGDIRTKMGHAEYAQLEGHNFNNQVSCPFKTPEEVLAFDPVETYGPRDKKELIRRFEADYQKFCQQNDDMVNMTGIYITCVSGLIEIFGWDMMLMAMGTDPDKFGLLTNRYAQWIQQYFDALAQADVPVVMVHDDIAWTSGPFAHPDWYRRYVFPNYKKYIRPLLDSGKKVLFTSDGTYTTFIDDIAKTGVHGFAMEPTTDMAYIAQKYGKTHVFIGNADTQVLLYGTKEQIRTEVERCMAIGRDCPGFFMAVGNHIPPNTPVENAMYYNEIYNELSKR
ncbi:MAG: uroporphyrinogen decarboxylase family protein [Sedimentisphaerales bacterium]